MDSLFQIFSQGDRSIHKTYGGTGLGLAICRQFVTLMGGRIGVSSQLGAGSEFWFVVGFETTPNYVPDETEALGSARCGSRLDGIRVLVVDDSDVNRDIAASILTLEMACVETAENGQQAVERLRRGPNDFDLVLMDVQMPTMDGLEATSTIRRELGLTNLPIIALTAGAFLNQRKQARASGMNAFIAKPFEIDTLLRTVARHGNSRNRPSPARSSPAARTRLQERPFPVVPGIDSQDAATRLMGKTQLFYRVLRSLRDDFRHIAAEVRAEIATDQWSAASRRARKLRGVAGNASARNLAKIAGTLESALTAADRSGAEKLLESLTDAWDEIISGLPPDIDCEEETTTAPSRSEA